MSDALQSKVFDLTEDALESNKKAVDIAASIKKSMDKAYGPTWHCIVGKNFGSFVSHESGNFIYFYVDNLAFLLFKTA
ncbi:DEKNAAC104279 [Brettanomyces naardenensis]|uniref:Dynein light chain n=1 Tax=Brettanomyces naardenensis TaxID=13370 RepID=A0A448YQ12_BRENA|nr:DEKNAAC104279 [Brettanomyces naardenensis]